MSVDEIRGLIEGGLPGAHVQVKDLTGTGEYFEAVVVDDTFEGQSLVERHQRVYGALRGAMADRIHALALRTYTSAEVEPVSR